MSAIDRVEEVVSGGESLQTATLEQLGTATAALEQATADWKTAEGERKEQFAKARSDAASEVQSIKNAVDAQNAKADAERDAEIDALIVAAKDTRAPSKAWAISGGIGHAPSGTYEPGSFVYDLYARKSSDFSITERIEAEKRLTNRGLSFQAVPGNSQGSLGGDAAGGFMLPQYVVESAAATILMESPGMDLAAKATLGLTAATGSGLIAGATVSDLIKPGRYVSAVARLVDSNTVGQFQTSIPVRVAAPTRAAVVAWGEVKTNANLAYGGYTATMYTLAIIYDIAKQWLRFSQGAAEADVMGELATSMELGKGYYILQGAGTTEPYGIQTAIATAFSAYTTSFTASTTTLAGSIAKAIATAAGDLAVRNRTPEAALLGAAAYWQMVSQGSEDAGFFFAPAGGPTAIRPGTLVSPFGIPVYVEQQLAGTDDLLIGEFSALDVFYGDSYRVDTSDEAGERWDRNLVGFRGELEMGLDARPAVFAGAFQFVADVIG